MPARPEASLSAAATSWRDALPVLHGRRVTLRELRRSDAPALLRLLSTAEVARFISPPPATVEQFEAFIAWTHDRRRQGRHVCYGVVPDGLDHAVGIFQVRPEAGGFAVADWGFALGRPFWGSGLFLDAARLTQRFAFDDLRVWRLAARAMAANGRGNGALCKAGAVLQGHLPRSFLKDGRLHDQTAWAILEPEWRRTIGSARQPGWLGSAPHLPGGTPNPAVTWERAAAP